MKARPDSRISQSSFPYPDLLDQLNPKDPLLLLADKISRERLEYEFAPLYAEGGRPVKPVRLMVGLLLHKQLANLSDEHVVNDIRISMDSKGRCMDNIFIERLWRPLKYEEIYIHTYIRNWTWGQKGNWKMDRFL